MREWTLKSSDPLSLTLVSDARLGPTDYVDDHIWELSLGGGEPPGLGLQTTFGLRARSFRILPRISEGDLALNDPSSFNRLPEIRQMYPNFISINFSPFPDIDVAAEYWVPEPHALTGRYFISNRDSRARQVRFEILGQLTPSTGQRMAAMEMQAAWVLAGETGGIFPLIFLTGGPQTGTGSYPSLLHTLNLSPGETLPIIWTLSARPTLEESFMQAREVAACKWDAERTYLDLLNAGQIEIFSGNLDWDAAFMSAQRIALSLLVGPTSHLPYPSFVLTRQPDQGFSLRGNGSDYNHLWNGQPALEADYLAGFLLPSATEMIKGILLNFLAVQDEEGFIDWKPGLAGQRSSILSTPMLASLAWRIYETCGDSKFLSEVFSGLLKFNQTWFKPAHDRDGDGVPEWDHTSQSGSENHPLYSRWHEWSRGIEINTAESPALSAFLYRECQCLIQMATLLGENDVLPALQASAERLRLAVEIAWDSVSSCYLDVDRDTHFSTRGELLGKQTGPGTLWVNRKFDQPVRLLIQIHSADGINHHPHLIIHGTSATGQPRLEHIQEERFKWIQGRGCYTGERVYQEIEQIEILRLEAEDEVEISTAGYDLLDQSSLLPLWAGIPDSQRANTMIEQTITNPARFWHPAGLPYCLEPPSAPDAIACLSADLIWNSLIGEGLVRYGHREAAADLVIHLMNGIIQNLKQENAFRRYYHSETGVGIGERGALQGLAPMGLFLVTLGVRLITAHKVELSGFNPFPWPITIKYRGLTVLRLKDKSTVIFPDGQAIFVDDPAPRIVALEFNQS
jgi:hypothetical protein